ncbi:MAG: hypothetical protein COY57_02195 [Flavobacteriales bacterium CG_4_10_14_0_8_um_filter_32_5]|nr:MAG: hypothetical protein COY57_02195 [Flavobacteriales bacterium CG_4_10_14_0_8_um_filter_32_5]
MKYFLKKLFQPLINLGMMMLFPKFKNKRYYTLTGLLGGIRQRLVGANKTVPWPVHFTSLVKSPEKIQPGTKAPGSAIGCYIDGRNGIIIEENVWTGPRVSIISQNHANDDYYSYVQEQPIIIRKNSLLATNCVILSGVELGEHTIVAAGAVVTQSFPEGNQVLAGNPAKVIKQLGEYKKEGQSL